MTVIEKLRRISSSDLAILGMTDVAYEQWSKIEQLALDLRKDPRQYEKVTEHYTFSIESMVEAAHERHVPVILVTVPVNLRHWHPNVSYQPLQGHALRAQRQKTLAQLLGPSQATTQWPGTQRRTDESAQCECP